MGAVVDLWWEYSTVVVVGVVGLLDVGVMVVVSSRCGGCSSSCGGCSSSRGGCCRFCWCPGSGECSIVVLCMGFADTVCIQSWSQEGIIALRLCLRLRTYGNNALLYRKSLAYVCNL